MEISIKSSIRWVLSQGLSSWLFSPSPWATMTSVAFGIWSYFSSLPAPMIAFLALASFIMVYFFVSHLQLRSLPSLLYVENDPNCCQTRGEVSPGGLGKVPYDETRYRLRVLSNIRIQNCRVVLADVEPKPIDPGRQRLGLAMPPRNPVSSHPAEFDINPKAPAFVDVLKETVREVNPTNEASTIQLIYVNENLIAKPFEIGEHVLTFRLEGPMNPVYYRLKVAFDQRNKERRWRVSPA